jgi:predicted NACHT family NTPase
VTGSWDFKAKLWEATSGKELLTLKGHTDWVKSVAFSPDGQRIVTGSDDKTAKVWDAASGRELFALRHTDQIWSVAFSPDGQLIVTSSLDKTAKLWEAASGKELLTLKGHNDAIYSVAFSPGGQRIVTGSLDKTAKLWEAASGKELLTLKGHTDSIWSVAFSPDGQRIVTGSADGTAKVWEAASGRELLVLKAFNRVFSVAFSADGQRIITGSSDGSAKVWDASGGWELLTLRQNPAIFCAAFSPDGQRILTGSHDHTATLWEAARPEQIAVWQEEERVAAQHLAALEREWSAEQERQRIAHACDSIKQWLILAPIALGTGQSGAEGLDIEQIEGEGQLRPKAGETRSTGGGELKWRQVASADYDDYVIDFNAILGREITQSVAYAVCYLQSEAEQRGLQMLVGSDDEAKVYLNGKQVYKAPAPHGIVAVQETVRHIALNAGLNVLVFKVVNETEAWKGSIRFTDTAGQPLKGVRVTLDPDGKN